MISLKSFDYVKADKYLPCDALQIWFDLKLAGKDLEKGIRTWFNARKGINTGETYLEYKFDVVDEETGEMSEQVLSCRIDMNKLMVKQNWYPPIIQQAFKKYKS